MFGIFQSDLPIGRGLWILLLVTVILGGVSDLPFSNFTEQPIPFISEILFLFGYNMVLGLGLLLALYLPFTGMLLGALALYKYFGKIEHDQLVYQFNVKQPMIWIGRLFGTIVYIISTVLALKSFGTSNMYFWGKWGLLLSLVIYLWPDDLKFVNNAEILILKSIGRGDVSVIWGTRRGKSELLIHVDWYKEIAALLDNGWEIIEYSPSDLSSISFKR